MKNELIYKQECYEILGACFEVYNEQGCGFTENVFQECLELEFSERNIPFKAQVELPMQYKSRPLKSKFKPDFVCYEKLIVELKAVGALAGEHRAQVLNYLHAGGFELGLLVNFGHHPRLDYERIVLTQKNIRAHSRDSRANSSGEIVS
jgi:GxxExxY protein